MTTTAEETALLAKVARQLGRRWKEELEAIWAGGSERARLRLTEAEFATLRRIRNTRGPSGLCAVVLSCPQGRGAGSGNEGGDP